MSRSALAILAIAILVSFGMWLSVRAAGLAEIELLPGRCRRRVRWWQCHARYAQLCCALAVVAAAGMQIGSTVG